MLYTYGYLFYLPITIISVILLIGINGILKKRPFAYYIMAMIAIVYINLLVKTAFFPLLIDDSLEFAFYYNICLRLQLTNLNHFLQNIILTIPIGIGIQYILDLRLKGRVIISSLLSGTIEIIQLVILITVRPIDMIFDINDLLANILGAIVGVCISVLINRLIVLIKFEKEYNDLFTYMYKIGYNCNHKRSSLYHIEKK